MTGPGGLHLALAGLLVLPFYAFAQSGEAPPLPTEQGPQVDGWASIFSPPERWSRPRPSALISALNRGDESEARRLLAEGADPNALWARAEPPLAIAIRRGSLPLVRLLLEHGAGVSGAVSSTGATMLHLAVRQRDLALVAALVEAGADVNGASPGEVQLRPERSGDTPLHEAAALGELALAEYLIGRGADVHAANAVGLTPLHHAAGAGQVEMISALLGRGAEIDRASRIGATPLHWAVHYGQVEAVRLLVDRGAEVNARTGQGSTPLHGAVARRNIPIVETLLAAGGEVDDAAGLHGETSLMLARRVGDPDLIRLLEARQPPSGP